MGSDDVSRTARTSAIGAVLSAALALVAAPALAQSEPEGNGVKVGETRLYPELRLDYLAYDNVYRDGAEPTEGSAVQLSPLVRWRAERRLVELEARYSGRYSSGSEDILSFAEHVLQLDGSVAPSSRSGIDGFVRYERLGEDLRLLDAADEPSAGEDGIERVDVDRFFAGGAYSYGARDARGNLAVGLDIDSYGADLQDRNFIRVRRDFLRVEPYARFSLRVSPDTRWLLEARFADVDFDEGLGDNTRASLLTGLEFAATGALRGSFRAGATRITYKDIEDEDATAARLDAALTYVPTSFSRFDLGVGRDIDPRFGDSSEITTRARLDWRHEYSDRVFHRARLSVEDRAADCPSTGDRSTDVGFELNVRVRRWIEVGVGVDHEIDTIEECAGIEIDEDLLEIDATRLGVHVRAIL